MMWQCLSAIRLFIGLLLFFKQELMDIVTLAQWDRSIVCSINHKRMNEFIFFFFMFLYEYNVLLYNN
jgi:hypothetical protein